MDWTLSLTFVFWVQIPEWAPVCECTVIISMMLWIRCIQGVWL